MDLTDTHCHLNLENFDSDRAEVLLRARQAGITRILVPGTGVETSRSAVQLALSHSMLFAAVGIHPSEANSFDASSLPALRDLARDWRVRAVGEIGLDYYWNDSPHPLQQEVLKVQLDLAAELCLPVVIHCREKGDAPDGPCAADLLVILEAWVKSLERDVNPLVKHPGVLHSFSGSLTTAHHAMELNFLLGVTGPVTHRKERQERITTLPLESLLIETDAPFMAPVPMRGKRNEPAFVRHIADKIALLQSHTLEQVAAVTSQNAARLFSWE